MTSPRPRILTPKYESAEHIKIVTARATAPGRPADILHDTAVSEQSVTAEDAGDWMDASHVVKPGRLLPPPVPSDPAMLSSQGQRRDITFQDQVEQLEYEVERDKETRRSVAGLDTEDLNAMLRAFDKQVQHVRLCPPPQLSRIPLGLDLHPDPEEELSAHKVRSALERLYASVGVGLLRVMREVQRIRSWEDGPRSTIALSIYSYAWYCRRIITMLLLFASIIVLFPASRRFLFENVPRRTHHGGEGAAVEAIVKDRNESEWGPAATEASATRWAEGIQDVIQSMSTGKTAEDEKVIKEDIKEDIEHGADDELVKLKAAGQANPEDDKRSHKEIVTRMYAQPTMRVIAGLADKWERLDHALQPKGTVRPTDRRWAVFAQLLLPLLVMSFLTSEQAVASAIGFVFGVLLFGQPLLSHIVDELDHTIPDWKSRLILEFNILETVPTNAQLVLDMLRQAERRKRPLPPATGPDVASTHLADGEENGQEENEDGGQDSRSPGDMRQEIISSMSHVTTKGKAGSRAKVRKAWDKLGKSKEDGFAILAGHKKLDVQGAAERVLDKLHISSDHKLVAAALDHMPSGDRGFISGEAPSSFYVWHKRHGPGHVVIHPHDDTTGTSARIEFSTIRRVRAEENAPLDPRREPRSGHLVVSVDDIIGLRKLGLGPIKGTALSWALDAQRAGGTGLEVTLVRRHLLESNDNAQDHALDLDEEDTITLTSIVRRDELFNRLVALGNQRWVMV